jgi:2-dehydro-3-deoxyphosphogluconate aldolase/(4S)-4-hydroxy-2-oxoglutarate aldolase
MGMQKQKNIMTSKLPSSKNDQIETLCSMSPVIPVLTFETVEEALPVSEALLEGGITVLEITLRTPVALDVIKMLSEKLPEAKVGAGTITTPELYHSAEEAGACFMVSPGLTNEILEAGVTSDIPLLPGIQTISEMLLGLQYNYQRFKFFPASVSGGPQALKAYSGPFGDVKFCPTGGISLDNAQDYLKLSNVMCVGGSWLAPKNLIEEKNWAGIKQRAQETFIKLQQG